MQKVYLASSMLSKAAAVIAGAILVSMTLLMLTEIVLRGLFGESTFIAEEYVGYGLASFTFLGLAYAMHHDSLLRLDLLIDNIPKGMRNIVIVLGMVLTLGVALILAYAIWESAASNFRFGTVSPTVAETPLWIPEALVVVGLVVFVLQLLLESWALLAGFDKASEKSQPADY